MPPLRPRPPPRAVRGGEVTTRAPAIAGLSVPKIGGGRVHGHKAEAGQRTQSSQRAVSPRGVRILAQSTEPVAQPYRFAGNYQDPTGLYHLQARYYDANIGRFTQPDPSGQEQNPYVYAEGDPVNRIDPNGLLSIGDAFGAAGDLFSGAYHFYQGDSRSLWGDVLGVVAGGLTTIGCEAVLTAGAPATLGASEAASPTCFAAGWAAGTVTSNAVSG
ncbi:RHS repeat-associated core domain-containing protein [Streptomyces sp. NPDC055109]